MDLKKESIKAFKYSHLMPKLFNNPTRTVLYNKLKILIISYEHYFQIIKTSITKYEMKTITLSKFSSVLSSLSNQTVKKTQFISNFFAFTNTHIIYEHIYICIYLFIHHPASQREFCESSEPSSVVNFTYCSWQAKDRYVLSMLFILFVQGFNDVSRLQKLFLYPHFACNFYDYTQQIHFFCFVKLPVTYLLGNRKLCG